MDRFFVYILASQRNGTLYVGITNDLVHRMTAHKGRLVPGFTRKYGVDKLMYVEEYVNSRSPCSGAIAETLAAGLEDRADRKEQSAMARFDL
jgi:predicted GIY-YIG superfamily endonuclease